MVQAGKAPLKEETPEATLCNQLFQLIMTITEHTEVFLEDHGITSEEAWLLRRGFPEGVATFSSFQELGEDDVVIHETISRCINNGFITAQPTDAAITEYRLTPLGLQFAEVLEQDRQQLLRSLCSGLSANEIATMTQLVTKLS